VSANEPNFVETVQEWFDKEDLSIVDVELNWSISILTSDHNTKLELSQTDDIEDYTMKDHQMKTIHFEKHLVVKADSNVQENSRSRIQKYDIFIQLLTSRIRA
jgi:hypothetical protein